jgi:hypothetical protein
VRLLRAVALSSRLVSHPPYRAPLPAAPDPYLVAWADVRWRRTVMWALLASLLPVAVASIILLHGRGFLMALAWTTAISLAWEYAGRFRCPRCSKAFGKRDEEEFAALPRHCVHCGIQIGTPKGVADAS